MDTHAITDTAGHARIVVPLDGSTLSEAALPFAALLARASRGTIHLARVHVPLVTSIDVGYTLPDFEEEIRQGEHDYLASAARRLATDAQVPAGVQLLEGPIGPAIRSHVEHVGATLVVVSTHGRTGLTRMWLGSTTDWFVRFLPVPVMVVRPRDEATALVPSFAHVLIALDGSARSEAIIPDAVQIGRLHGARYTLLQVVPTIVRELAPYAAPTFPPVRDEDRMVELMRRAKDSLERIADGLRRESTDLDVRTEVVASDRVAEAILERAQAGNAGVIALSSHGRGASRLLVGSVADKVLRGFSGAMLILGPAAVREPRPGERMSEQETAAGAR
jgi:nucleotide-binding universal stress UspA family protein